MKRIAITAVSLLSLLVILFVWEYQRRRGFYWYDVQQDYEFNFAGDSVTKLPVEISSDGFVCPKVDGEWDTALLRISVSSGVSALWFEPSVAIQSESNNAKSHQYFERGARGVRYLNLGSLLGEERCAGNHVRMEGRYLSWERQTGELILFRNVAASAKRILVIAPHPDDAEIAAFGLYAFRDAFIVTITAGNYVNGSYKHIYSDLVKQDSLIGLLRTWDSIVVPMWGGIPPARSVNLGYFTQTLERMHSTPGSSVGNKLSGAYDMNVFRNWNVTTLLDSRTAVPTWESLVEDLALLIQELRPEIIVSPHPALDANSDHKFTTIAVLDALKKAGDTKSTLYLYTNHHVYTEYFPFGPADALVTLPPWFDGSLAFRGVYSQPLDDRRQTEKLFALEAMHDLRSAPRRFIGQPTMRFLERLTVVASELWREPFGTYSYYRRAVRPNELFFVYSAADHESLRAYVEKSY
jgi:LmbE family N-acetylglucosaminyl deacetylase